MRRFMYLSIGILALILAFHLRATAQDPQDPFVGIVTGTGNMALSESGDVWYSFSPHGPWEYRGRIEGGGSAPFVAPATNGHSQWYAIRESGHMWRSQDTGLSWEFLGVIGAGTTDIPSEPSLTPSTWGKVKAGALR